MSINSMEFQQAVKEVIESHYQHLSASEMVGVFVKCQHYRKWLTDSTMRSWCYCRGRKFVPVHKKKNNES